MGVQGLWSLLEQAGKPVPLESLENKILAIDVSIWLNQWVRGFRDSSGAALPNAHLLGLFHRICKLLFYRVRPIFVFDGAPPQLKKDTLFRRRQRRGAAQRKNDAARAKLIENYLRTQVVQKKLERQTHQVENALNKGQEGLANLLNKRSKQMEKDLFQLPEVKKDDDDPFSSDSEREDLLSQLDIDAATDIHAVDVESDKFKALSQQKQYEVLLELRERRKQNSWAKVHEMPKNADNFSGFQLQRCLKRSQIQKRMDDVGNTLTEDNLESTIMGHKLFVGDREGLKKLKSNQKRIAGKDFLYLSSAKPAKSRRVDDSDEPVAGTSKEADDFEDEPDEPDEFTQSELLGMIQGVKKSAAQLEDEEDDPDIIEVTEVSMKSSRQGGVPLNGNAALLAQIKEEPVEEQAAETSNVEGESLEIHLNLESAPQAEEDDLFADVFAPMEPEKENRPSDITAMLEKETRREEGAVVEEMLSSSDSDGDEESNSAHGVIAEALQYDKTEDIFAHIAKKGRSQQQLEGISSSNKSLTQDLAQRMKQSDHLLLKITSKYMEEESSKAAAAAEPEKEKVSSPSKKTDMALSLENEAKALVEEMKSKQRESKLMAIKNQAMPGGMLKTAHARDTGSSEHDLLSALNAKAVDADHYNKTILGEGESKSPTDRSDIVYGSSAPGFVRSKKDNVVETEPQDQCDTPVALDQSISIKLEAPEPTEDNILTEQELRQIQQSLAKEQNQLIAERGRQERLAATLSDQMYAECQELLQLFGIPWMVAPCEAEAQCAFLDMNALSEGTITDDSDIWVFGGQTVFKNFFNQDKHCERFCATEISKHIGLSRDKMILFAMLTGSDYTEGIDDVGPVTAMEILAEFRGHGIEPLRKFREWWDAHKKDLTLPPGSKVRENFRRLQLLDSFPSVMVHDAYMKPSVNNSLELFSWAVPNFVEIQDYAQDKLGWSRQKVDEIMKPVIKTFSKKLSQGRIENYFKPERISLPEKGNIQKSKRVQAAIQKAMDRIVATTEPKPKVTKATSKTSTSNPKAARSSTPSTSSVGTGASYVGKTAKELNEERKSQAKSRAIEILKKSSKKAGKKKVPKRGRGRRVALPEHYLSESDSD